MFVFSTIPTVRRQFRFTMNLLVNIRALVASKEITLRLS